MVFLPKSYAQALQNKVKARERREKREAKAAQIGLERPTLPQAKRKAPKAALGSKSWWHKRLWAMASLWVREGQKRATGKCRLCAARPVQNACHILSRVRWAIRYLPANLYGGCQSCNRGEYLNRSLYADKHEAMVGKEQFERLRSWGKLPADFSAAELETMHAEFKRRYEEGDFSPFTPEPIRVRIIKHEGGQG